MTLKSTLKSLCAKRKTLKSSANNSQICVAYVFKNVRQVFITTQLFSLAKSKLSDPPPLKLMSYLRDNYYNVVGILMQMLNYSTQFTGKRNA